MVLVLIALYRSESIFIKARTRDVREILSNNVVRYEHNIRIKLIGKFILSVFFLYLTIDRIRNGYAFISNTAMWLWFFAMIVLLVISFIDFKFSAPENED